MQSKLIARTRYFYQNSNSMLDSQSHSRMSYALILQSQTLELYIFEINSILLIQGWCWHCASLRRWNDSVAISTHVVPHQECNSAAPQQWHTAGTQVVSIDASSLHIQWHAKLNVIWTMTSNCWWILFNAVINWVLRDFVLEIIFPIQQHSTERWRSE